MARNLVEMAMCLEKRCAFTGEIDAIQPSHLAAKIYNFVNCNALLMTCLEDGSGQVPNPATMANTLYPMLHIELKKT